MFSEEWGWKGHYRAVPQSQENVDFPTQEVRYDQLCCQKQNILDASKAQFSLIM